MWRPPALRCRKFALRVSAAWLSVHTALQTSGYRPDAYKCSAVRRLVPTYVDVKTGAAELKANIGSFELHKNRLCRILTWWTDFPKIMGHLKILGTRSVTRSKFHTEGPRILGATVQNLVATATCRLWFVPPCSSLHPCLFPRQLPHMYPGWPGLTDLASVRKDGQCDGHPYWLPLLWRH